METGARHTVRGGVRRGVRRGLGGKRAKRGKRAGNRSRLAGAKSDLRAQTLSSILLLEQMQGMQDTERCYDLQGTE